MSLVGGTAHPIAPQLHTVRTADGVEGTVVLGPAYEGGPGLAHGGVLSLLFDHAMGQALFTAGYAAMTVSLEVRYRAPTPLEAPLAVSARLDRVDGRKLFVAGQIAVGGRVTAEAQGVFVQLTEANVAQIFAPGRVPDGPPPPDRRLYAKPPPAELKGGVGRRSSERVEALAVRGGVELLAHGRRRVAQGALELALVTRWRILRPIVFMVSSVMFC